MPLIFSKRLALLPVAILCGTFALPGAPPVDYLNSKGFKLPNGEKVTREESQACLDDNQKVCESIARRCLRAGAIEAAESFFGSAALASMGAGQYGNSSFRYGRELEDAGGDGVEFALGMFKDGCESTNFPSADACGAYGRLLEAAGGKPGEIHYVYERACTLGGVTCEKLSLEERINALRRGPGSILDPERQKNELEAGLQKAPPDTAHSFMQNIAAALATNGGTNAAAQSAIDAQRDRELQDQLAAQQAQQQAQLREAEQQLAQQRAQQEAGQQQALDLIRQQRSAQARSSAATAGAPQTGSAAMAALLGPAGATKSTQDAPATAAVLDSLLGPGPARQNAGSASSASALDSLLGSAPAVPAPATTDAVGQSGRPGDLSKMGYIHAACKTKWNSWTAACCKVFETQDDCKKDSTVSACVEFDMSMLRALASAEGARPACSGTE